MKHNLLGRVGLNMAAASQKRWWLKHSGFVHLSVLESMSTSCFGACGVRLCQSFLSRALRVSVIHRDWFMWPVQQTMAFWCVVSACLALALVLKVWQGHRLTWPAVRQNNEGQSRTHGLKWIAVLYFWNSEELIAATLHHLCFLIKPSSSSLCTESRNHKGVKTVSRDQMEL